MGIRMTQEVGLNGWATKFVEGEPVYAYTEHVRRVFPDGREETSTRDVHESSVRKEESGEFFFGMFEEEERPLHRYTLPDGRVYYERVQAEPWSSGPVIFLALVDKEGNWVPESLWPDEEIEAA